MKRRITLACLAAGSTLLAGCGSGSGSDAAGPAPLMHLLFVGDSFTHGRYSPVRPYNSGGTEGAMGSNLVVDENFGQTGARAELEPGPWGGIPGIFAEFAVEQGLNVDVHIEAISATSLHNNYAAASSVIDQAKWNAVVLQEVSTRPLPEALTADSTSDPSNFCASVKTIEQGVHAVAPQAGIYLYEPQPRADLAETLSGSTSASGFTEQYMNNLAVLGTADHNAYYSAAADDGHIAGVAPAGEAWPAAWAAGIANPNPFTGTSSAPLLWYGINPVNDPQITAPDYLHPSVYGAYLNALVLFQTITGIDADTLGASERAAASLGISPSMAVQLQQVASQTVRQASFAPPAVDPCTLKH